MKNHHWKHKDETDKSLLLRRGWKKLKKSDKRHTTDKTIDCWEEPFTGRLMTEDGAAYREVHRYNCPHTPEQEKILERMAS